MDKEIFGMAGVPAGMEPGAALPEGEHLDMEYLHEILSHDLATAAHPGLWSTMSTPHFSSCQSEPSNTGCCSPHAARQFCDRSMDICLAARPTRPLNSGQKVCFLLLCLLASSLLETIAWNMPYKTTIALLKMWPVLLVLHQGTLAVLVVMVPLSHM